jgi:hypothetical protein
VIRWIIFTVMAGLVLASGYFIFLDDAGHGETSRTGALLMTVFLALLLLLEFAKVDWRPFGRRGAGAAPSERTERDRPGVAADEQQ